MTKYHYYLVEGTYLVRRHRRGAEFVKPDWTWLPYDDLWDIETNGRYLCDDEEEAMKQARALFERLKEMGFEYR